MSQLERGTPVTTSYWIDCLDLNGPWLLSAPKTLAAGKVGYTVGGLTALGALIAAIYISILGLQNQYHVPT